jgi:hypothetical protein
MLVTASAGSHFSSDRRLVLIGSLASGSLILMGCSPSGAAGSEQVQQATASAAAAAPGPSMTVFRDANCGCCKSWAEIARKAGYAVSVRDEQDMPGVKRRLGVPEALASCHTVEVGGYVIEGHVPLEEVARLLREKPAGVRGIAVPGMPIGSPGMEVPDGTKQPFQVIAFDAAGNSSVFRA